MCSRDHTVRKPKVLLCTSNLQSDINRTPCTMSVGFSFTGNISLSSQISTTSFLRDTCSVQEVTSCHHFPLSPPWVTESRVCAVLTVQSEALNHNGRQPSRVSLISDCRGANTGHTITLATGHSADWGCWGKIWFSGVRGVLSLLYSITSCPRLWPMPLAATAAMQK